MKKVTLSIPENKLEFYIEVFKQFGLEVTDDGIEIPEWQKQLAKKGIDENSPEKEGLSGNTQK